jgi:hypothetical protein
MVEMFGGTDAGAVVLRGGYRATSAKLTNLREEVCFRHAARRGGFLNLVLAVVVAGIGPSWYTTV